MLGDDPVESNPPVLIRQPFFGRQDISHSDLAEDHKIASGRLAQDTVEGSLSFRKEIRLPSIPTSIVLTRSKPEQLCEQGNDNEDYQDRDILGVHGRIDFS
jgi:hypothetical protein